MLKRINNRSDFGITINFHNPDGSLRTVPTAPFRMIFSTIGGSVTYEVDSDDSRYCRKLDATTLSVFFDFSNHAYFRNGELTCTFIFSEKNEFFADETLDTKQIFRTGYVIWDGPSDFSDYLNVRFITNYEGAVLQFDSISEFPEVGNGGNIYIDTSAVSFYFWSDAEKRYVPLSNASEISDITPEDIDNIMGEF